MKTIIAAAVGAALVSGFVATTASAGQRTPTHRSHVVQQGDGFRNAYNAYAPSYESRGYYGALAEGGAIAAPAGR